MNFISTFDELNKLYEDAANNAEEAVVEGIFKKDKEPAHVLFVKVPSRENDWRPDAYSSDMNKISARKKEHEATWSDEKVEFKIVNADAATKLNKDYKRYSVNLDEACKQDELIEAAEDEEVEIVEDEIEIVDDETSVEGEELAAEEPAEEEETTEPKQVILECDKCGAFVIKNDEEMVIDEETDLVNVEDECQFCEETKGYKIVGIVVPYEETEDTEEPMAEGIFGLGKKKKSTSEKENTKTDNFADDAWVVITTHRKSGDYVYAGSPAPADHKDWAVIRKKDQARNTGRPESDYEIVTYAKAKKLIGTPYKSAYSESLEEIFDISPAVTLNLDGGQGNDVDVL